VTVMESIRYRARGRLNTRIAGRLHGVRVTITAACGAVALFTATAAPAAASTYTVTDLGTLGYPTARGSAINEGGRVAGTSYLAESVEYNVGCPLKRRPCHVHPEHPFLYSGGTITDLGTLGGLFAEGAAINSAGDVAGLSYLSGNGQRNAFLVHSGHMTDLGALVPGGESSASGVNDFGEVVGSSSVSAGGKHAFLYRNGKMTDLGLIPGSGGIYTVATGINNVGQVVGSGDNAESDSRAWLYSGAKMTDLGTLGGPGAAANAINNHGEIVGSSQTASDSEHPFLYKGGKMIDLGTFNLESVANAINNNGVIVGLTYELEKSGNAGFHAFIYSGGHFQDLNSLIPAGSGLVLTDATGINDKGQIVADAHNTTSGQNRAVLLNPS
jgi:probable HAF family extracellular repeat protein